MIDAPAAIPDKARPRRLLSGGAAGSAADAVQLLRLPPGLPAGSAGGARACRALPARLAAAGPRPPVLRLLRLVGPALRAAAGGLDPGELGNRPRLPGGAPALADPGRDRGQPPGARALQVPRLPRRSGRPDPGRRPRAARLGAAARHLLLHLPPHHVPDGPEGRPRAGLRARQIRPLHRLLPAGSRRPARALERDHAPVRRAALCAAGRGGADRTRADAAHHRARQEGLPRRSAGGLRQPGLPGGGGGARGGRGRGLAGGAGLHLPDLFRLLRLHRHGTRHRAAVRHRAAAELRRALPRHVPARLLAPLAHDPVAVPARLSLHPDGRQPERARHPGRRAVRHHGAGRPLARGGPHLRRLGGHCTGSGSGPARSGGGRSCRCRRWRAGSSPASSWC